jgi:hypothetical protein
MVVDVSPKLPVNPVASRVLNHVAGTAAPRWRYAPRGADPGQTRSPQHGGNHKHQRDHSLGLSVAADPQQIILSQSELAEPSHQKVCSLGEAPQRSRSSQDGHDPSGRSCHTDARCSIDERL